MNLDELPTSIDDFFAAPATPTSIENALKSCGTSGGRCHHLMIVFSFDKIHVNFTSMLASSKIAKKILLSFLDVVVGGGSFVRVRLLESLVGIFIVGIVCSRKLRAEKKIAYPMVLRKNKHE